MSQANYIPFLFSRGATIARGWGEEWMPSAMASIVCEVEWKKRDSGSLSVPADVNPSGKIRHVNVAGIQLGTSLADSDPLQRDQ